MMELLVSAGLLGLVLTLGLEFLLAGIKYLRNAEFAQEVQRTCLVGVATISKDLAESHPGSTYSFPLTSATATNPVGVVLATPRNSGGHLTVSTQTGQLVWPGVICYFYDQVNQEVVQSRIFVPTAFLAPPTVGPTAKPYPAGLLCTPADFFNGNIGPATGGLFETRVLCRNVKYFNTYSNPTFGGVALGMVVGAEDDHGSVSVYRISTNVNILPRN